MYQKLCMLLFCIIVLITITACYAVKCYYVKDNPQGTLPYDLDRYMVMDLAYLSPNVKEVLAGHKPVLRIEVKPYDMKPLDTKLWNCWRKTETAGPPETFYTICVSALGSWRAITSGYPHDNKNIKDIILFTSGRKFIQISAKKRLYVLLPLR